MYARHPDIDGDECFYCGHFGNTIDHCPALATVHLYPEFEKIVVKSCRGCNLTLSFRPLPTLLSRCEYLIKKYTKKYFKYLHMPEWTEEELASLCGSLKIYIATELEKVKTCQMRIEFLISRADELRENL
jgi:hypothetical protein